MIKIEYTFKHDHGTKSNEPQAETSAPPPTPPPSITTRGKRGSHEKEDGSKSEIINSVYKTTKYNYNYNNDNCQNKTK